MYSIWFIGRKRSETLACEAGWKEPAQAIPVAQVDEAVLLFSRPALYESGSERPVMPETCGPDERLMHRPIISIESMTAPNLPPPAVAGVVRTLCRKSLCKMDGRAALMRRMAA